MNDIFNMIKHANPERHHSTLPRRILKLSEEQGEIAEAYLNVTSEGNGKGKTWGDVREEMVDLLIVDMDCLFTRMPGEENLTDEEIEAVITGLVVTKLEKWHKNKALGKNASDA